jgi:hypothetical protein
MSKIKQTKIPMTLTEDNVLKIAIEQEVIMWLEWNEDGRGKDRHSEPEVGRSLLMSPFNDFFTWMTTDITEILEQEDNYIKFKTRNSTYELWHKDN